MVLHAILRSSVLRCLAFLLVIQSVQAETSGPAQDEVVLKNGSRIIGEVTGSRDGVVSIETDFAGKIDVAIDKIKSVNTQNPVVILLADDTVQRDDTLVIKDDELVLAGVGQTYPLDDLAIVNPRPWELGQGYRWTGLVSLAMARQTGNTDTRELDYALESKWRSKRDRYTIQANGETDEADGNKTADDWLVRGKYDYFLEDPNYVGLLAQVEKDKF